MQQHLSIGQIVDAEGVAFDLDDGDLVAGVVVLAKIVNAVDGSVTLGLGSSESNSWLEDLGLITAALQVVNSGGMVEIGNEDADYE